MNPEQHPLQPEHMNLWQMLWASPMLLLTLFFKGLREWVGERIKAIFTPKERREEVITRAEFEARHNEMKQDFNLRFDEFGNKLDAHSAQARIDSRELKADLKAEISEVRSSVKDMGHDLFNKMDNFLAMISMRSK